MPPKKESQQKRAKPQKKSQKEKQTKQMGEISAYTNNNIYIPTVSRDYEFPSEVIGSQIVEDSRKYFNGACIADFEDFQPGKWQIIFVLFIMPDQQRICEYFKRVAPISSFTNFVKLTLPNYKDSILEFYKVELDEEYPNIYNETGKNVSKTPLIENSKISKEWNNLPRATVIVKIKK